MARPSTTGMPFLVRRPGSLTFSYWRNLPPSIAGELRGLLRCSWSGVMIELAGKSVVRVSLKTSDSPLARKRWAEVHGQIEDRIAECLVRKAQPAQKRVSLTPDQIAAIAGQVRHDLLKEHEAAWVANVPWDRMNNAESRQALAERALKALQDRSLDWMDFDSVTEVLRANPDPFNPELVVESSVERLGEISQRARENGVAEKLTPTSMRQTGLAILGARSAALHDIEDRESGRSIPTPARPVMPTAPAVSTAVTLSGMHQRWLKENKPAAKVARDYELYLGYFTETFGDLPVKEITRDLVIEFSAMMQKFPRSRPHVLRGAHPSAIVNWAEMHPKVPRLSKRTINHKALAPIAGLMDLAVAHGFIPHNPCVGVKLKGVKAGARKIEPFDETDLKRLRASPVFSKPVERQTQPGGEATYWIPLIALFAGARLEEIGQLRTADIKMDRDGIAYLDISTVDDGDDDHLPTKKVKTASSTRAIPLHSTLLALGFMDYVNRMRGNREVLLFPKLTLYRGRYTKNFSRWWARYQDAHIAQSPNKVFHSFRHTFNRALRDGFVEEEFRKLLLGHASGSVNQHYGAGMSLAPLRDLLEQAKFPNVDFGAKAQ